MYADFFLDPEFRVAEELEIKLTLTDQALEQAIRWLLAQPEASEGPEKLLVNRYFDTPDCELNRERAALRVRQAGDQYIQTLKTRGEFVDGAHKRQEWEWQLPTADLDLSLLAGTAVADTVDLKRLRPVFETNFRRRVVMLSHTDENGADTAIEVAVDQGQVISGDAVRPLAEVEFELKQGHPSVLIEWAMKLAVKVPVFLNLVSKAEQGYFLAGLYQPTIATGDAKAPLDINGFLFGLSVLWLTGEPLSFGAMDVSIVEQHARRAGVGQLWSECIQAVSEGSTLSELIDSGELGQLQLALATA